MLIQVAPSLNIFEPLTYSCGSAEDLKPGQRVIIPIGSRITSGWVIETGSSYKGRVKQIPGFVKDDYLPGKNYAAFARSAADIYFTSIGLLLDSSLSPKKKPLNSLYFYPPHQDKKQKAEKLAKYLKDKRNELQKMAAEGPIEFFYKAGKSPAGQATIPNNVDLREKPQSKVFAGVQVPGGDTLLAPVEKEKNGGPETERLQSLNASPRIGVFSKSAPCSPKAGKFLLSYDRLEQYRELIALYKAKGQSVLFIVPDNMSARYWQQQLEGSDIYNSEVKAKERENLWHEYARGSKAGVVIGGLSAVMLPIADLGAVICERAGSPLYKTSYYSKFDVSRLAGLRAESFAVPLIEGFSTYTVTAYQGGAAPPPSKGDERKKELPPVEVYMVNYRKKGIAPQLLEMLKTYFLEKKKILVFLSKKEGDDFLFCPKCKKIQKCPGCSAQLKISGKKEQGLFFPVYCSRCGFKRDIMDACPKCNSTLNKIEDTSIASLERSIRREIVETGVMTFFGGPGQAEAQLEEIESSRIVISTPALINPFFKGIFDVLIYIEPSSIFTREYYAAETTFSLVSELRELVKEKGNIDIFSTFHFHYALQLVNDETAFFQRELKYRQWFLLPPFAYVYNIEVKAANLRKLAEEMRKINKKFKTQLGIKRIYLFSRQRIRGAYRGIIEAHTFPQPLQESRLLQKKNIAIEPVMI